MRPVILGIFFCLGLSSCNMFAPAQSETEPTTTPEIFNPLPAEQRAFEAVRAILAEQLGVDPLTITLVEATPVDWPDTCLGLPSPGEACAQHVTPGFRVRVQGGDVGFEFHTDLNAKYVRQVK